MKEQGGKVGRCKRGKVRALPAEPTIAECLEMGGAVRAEIPRGLPADVAGRVGDALGRVEAPGFTVMTYDPRVMENVDFSKLTAVCGTSLPSPCVSGDSMTARLVRLSEEVSDWARLSGKLARVLQRCAALDGHVAQLRHAVLEEYHGRSGGPALPGGES